MIASVAEFGERLREIDPEDDHFNYKVDRVIEELAPGLAESVYPAVFAYYEANPESYCGCPGSLTHLVEHYDPNYIPALKESVRRMPSQASVLMINRILNSELSEEERVEYIEILREVAKDESIPWEVSEAAEEYLKRREEIDGEEG